MAKRYYQSSKDRKDESRGMKLRDTYDRAREKDKQQDQANWSDGSYKNRSAKKNGSPYEDMRLRDYYSGYDARKRMEAEGADMIYEDHREIANLPHEVMFKEYPKTPYDNYGLNDDIKGIDVQMRDDVLGGRRKSGEPYPDKW